MNYKKISIIIITFILLFFLGYIGFEYQKYIRIKNAISCANSNVTEDYLKNCKNIWGEPGNECRAKFYKSICGKEINAVFFNNER